MTINKNKFRIWDKKYKMWADPHRWRLNAQGEVTWNRILSSPNGQEDFVIQQFTGMVDKNGKEIWEGDIVKFYKWNCPMPSPNVEDYLVSSPKQIIYGLGYGDYPTAGFCAISLFPTDLETGHQLNCMDSQNIEIIGNVFENPELLNKND